MMDFSDFSRALHVVEGDSAGGSLKVALRLRSDQFLVNKDPISYGPAPATDDLSVWRATRERFIGDFFAQGPDFRFNKDDEIDLLMNAERLCKEDQVVVWVACTVPEQLLLAWVVFLYDRLKLDLSNLSVVQFEYLRPRERCYVMGELRHEYIHKFGPTARHLRSEEVEELRRAWRVYTSSDPADLSRYVADPGPMPFLHQAISQLVYRYPDLRSGISIWEQRLLRDTVEEGPETVSVVGHTMIFSDTLDRVGDGYLFRSLIDLGSADLASPLVSITGDTRAMRFCEVELTSFGQKVLAGEANHVKENGIDDWIGGVHLSAEGPVTFREGDALVLPL